MVGAAPAGSIAEPSGALRTTWQAACFLDRLVLGKFSPPEGLYAGEIQPRAWRSTTGETFPVTMPR